MLVGIKYCGGCNSKYDRSKFLKALNQKLPKVKKVKKVKTEFISIGKEYDYVFIVCGCASCCADLKNIKSKNPLIYIKNELDFENINLIFP